MKDKIYIECCNFDTWVRKAQEAYRSDDAIKWAKLATSRGPGSLAKRQACDFVEAEARGWVPLPEGKLTYVEKGTN